MSISAHFERVSHDNTLTLIIQPEFTQSMHLNMKSVWVFLDIQDFSMDHQNQNTFRSELLSGN